MHERACWVEDYLCQCHTERPDFAGSGRARRATAKEADGERLDRLAGLKLRLSKIILAVVSISYTSWPDDHPGTGILRQKMRPWFCAADRKFESCVVEVAFVGASTPFLKRLLSGSRGRSESADLASPLGERDFDSLRANPPPHETNGNRQCSGLIHHQSIANGGSMLVKICRCGRKSGCRGVDSSNVTPLPRQ